MDIDKLTENINTFENDLGKLIQLRTRLQIDDTFYIKEYQRILAELDKLSEKKESLREVNTLLLKNPCKKIAVTLFQNLIWKYRKEEVF